jgi:protein SCO1
MTKKPLMLKRNPINFSVIALLFLLIACTEKKERVLPILGNYDLEYKTIDGKEVLDTVYPTIPPFRFLNEDSIWVSNADFKGKIWIAEFFFATCPTICPVMNQQMKRFTEETKDIAEYYQILSFTINPKNDSPSVLKKYKESHGISLKNWSFLTGVHEDEVHRMGIENFITFAGRDDESAGGYAHSGAFTLVDKKGYVRGVYAITNYDSSINESEYKRMITEIRKLLKYEYKLSIAE